MSYDNKPAAAQEAVGWQWRWLDSGDNWSEWIDGGSRKEIDARIARWKADGEGHLMQVRPVFASPVTAAPAEPDLDAHDPASGELAAQWLYGIGLKELAFVVRTQLDMRGARIRELSASTPAAPGIDLAERVLALIVERGAIDAGSTTHRDARSLIDASSNGGSEAQDAARWRFIKTWGRQLQVHGTQDCNFGISTPTWRGPWIDLDAAIDAQMQATSAEAGEEQCESGSPDCGPVEHWDSEAVPLCARCWEDLTNSQSPGRRNEG